MKYWRINSFCKSGAREWMKSKVLGEIEMHLSKREYKCRDLANPNLIETPDNKSYKIRKVWNAEGNIFSVFVQDESNWKSSTSAYEPQIVTLIQDYFKINCHVWYYLETLNEVEDSKISKSNREIEPIQIKEYLDVWDGENIPPKPSILEIGEYDYEATDIYYGLKTQFQSLFDFWISCLYWVRRGNLKGEGLMYLEYFRNSYDLQSGSCIPMNLDEIQEITDEIKTKNTGLKTPLNAYLMRKDWSDKIYVLEYDDRFVMHNWHTAE